MALAGHRALEIKEVGRRKMSVAILRGGAKDPFQLGAIGVRQRLEQDVVDQAEDRSVGADAESERDNGKEGVAGGFPQRTHAEAQILRQVFQPAPAALLAHLLLDISHVPELAKRGIMRLLRGHPACDVLPSPLLQVQAHFLRHVSFESIPAKQRDE